MADFKDRDDFLDQLFDHIFGEDEVDDDDHAWFDAKVASFFDQVVEGNKPPGRRRAKQGPAAPKRRRPGAAAEGAGEKGDKDKGGGYGAGWLFGGS
jgi:hypothetical protein